MKKLGVFLIILVFTLFLVLAQNGDSNDSDNDGPPLTDDVDRAYQCLSDLIDEKSEGDISLQEAIFSTLALGSPVRPINAHVYHLD